MSEPSTSTATPAAPAVPQLSPLAEGRAPISTAPCFCCGSTTGVPVGWTYWGFLMPKLLHHVKCVDCPVHYNARTGESNDPWIVALHLIYLVAGIGVGGAIYLATR